MMFFDLFPPPQPPALPQTGTMPEDRMKRIPHVTIKIPLIDALGPNNLPQTIMGPPEYLKKRAIRSK
jgi:hypothetical protein